VSSFLFLVHDLLCCGAVRCGAGVATHFVGVMLICLCARQDSWPLMKAGYKLWPIVSLLSFTVVPVQQRVVFGSLVGVGWGIFLSLFAGH